MSNPTTEAQVTILGEAYSGRTSGIGLAAANRSVDISGVYAEMTIRIEHGKWGGRMGNRLTIYPRPSVPVDVWVSSDAWEALSDFETSDALEYALSKVTEQARDWVERFVLPLSPDAR